MDRADRIDAVWKRLDRPLWVVTSGGMASDCQKGGSDDARGGLIATWVTQSSLDPKKPTVTAGIAPNHFTCDLIDRTGSFGLHLLRVDQAGLIQQFADGSGRGRDKLAGIALRQSETGPPILEDCLAWLDCRVTARMDGGDRVFFWADVMDGAVDGADGVLRESHIGALDPELLARLDEDRIRDIQVQAPMAQAWRDNLPREMRPRH